MSLTTDHYIRLIEEPLLTLAPQGGMPRRKGNISNIDADVHADAERNKYLFMTERENKETDDKHLKKHGIIF